MRTQFTLLAITPSPPFRAQGVDSTRRRWTFQHRLRGDPWPRSGSLVDRPGLADARLPYREQQRKVHRHFLVYIQFGRCRGGGCFAGTEL